jgi:Ni/Co efflux regulator RcnB
MVHWKKVAEALFSRHYSVGRRQKAAPAHPALAAFAHPCAAAWLLPTALCQCQRTLVVSAIAISLLAGAVSPAYADSNDRGGRHERNWDNRGRDRGHDRSQYRNDRRDSWRADNRNNHGYRDYRGYGRVDSRHYYRDDRRYDRFNGRYYDGRRYYSPSRHDYSKRYYGGRYYRPSGYRYYSWHRGDRLPYAYYAPRYVLRDYRAYRLYAPPRGYHWVRVDNDVVLAAITTGIVLSVFDNIFY